MFSSHHLRVTQGNGRVLKRRKEESGGGDVDMSDVLDNFQKKARDHARVPMQVRIIILVPRGFGSTEWASGIQPNTQASQRDSLGCV